MAGIGFRLQALITRGSYLQATTAYLSSVVISAGPWLAGVVALLVLNGFASSYLSTSNQTLLSATIVTVFAVSLLLTGGPQMLVTRYLADRLYEKDIESIAPACSGVVFLLLPFALFALPFLLFAPFDLRYRLLVTTLFLVLCMIWMVMIFLSAAREHIRILFIFTFCYALSVGASIMLGHLYALTGSILGFTAGQMLCLMLLLASVYREFPATREIDLSYLGYIFRYREIALIGALYTLGIWADNLLFWFSPHAEVVDHFYHLFPAYDTAKFLAYLSTILASGVFMIHVETNFHCHYQDFYRLISTQGTLSELRRAREGMMQAVKSGVWTLLKIQGGIALFLCLIAQDMASYIGLDPRWVPLLRYAIVASSAQFFAFIMLLLLLYLDQRRTALFLVTVFLLCNLLFTLISLFIGEHFYGLGYLITAGVGAILGWHLLRSRLKHLEFTTFMTPSVG